MAFRIRQYPHNDLLNLAHYHHEIIQAKVADGVQDAIALDCTSCLIALAFSVEALVNFVGSRKVTDWNESAKAPAKIAKLSKALSLPMGASTEPFAAIVTLRQIRNGLAHGKPAHKIAAAASSDELNLAMQTPWDRYRDPKTVSTLYRQVIELRKVLFDAAGIRWVDTITSAIGSN
ncbi:hypothetical protein [Paraburkholderia caledonica]|uniref:hypothetical protein n=1 Tax=Paraburkholderia caledonica TaxID=134536 RepID=UPI0001443086|nr:hypothetical protein BWU74_32740 [Burkholderia sp. Bk]